MDRARAIAAVAEEAETIFATEGRVIQPALSGPAIPSSSTWKPTVDPQTMENAPAAAAATSQETLPFDNEKPLVDVEHLQLTLQEALFLCWNLDCLTILDPQTVSISQKLINSHSNILTHPTLQQHPMSLKQIWLAFQSCELVPQISTALNLSTDLRFDNPFIINYVVYHHYRSLGWVVKGGIKFCVDYLLYKRGPVFAHAEYDFFASLPPKKTKSSYLTDWPWSLFPSTKTKKTRNLHLLTYPILHLSLGPG